MKGYTKHKCGFLMQLKQINFPTGSIYLIISLSSVDASRKIPFLGNSLDKMINRSQVRGRRTDWQTWWILRPQLR